MRQDLSCSREADRTRVLMIATVYASDGAHRVRVRDISVSGAQLFSEGPIPVESDVIFKRGTIFVAARVVRSDERQTGLRFYRELTFQELDSTFHTVKA